MNTYISEFVGWGVDWYVWAAPEHQGFTPEQVLSWWQAQDSLTQAELKLQGDARYQDVITITAATPVSEPNSPPPGTRAHRRYQDSMARRAIHKKAQ